VRRSAKRGERTPAAPTAEPVAKASSRSTPASPKRAAKSATASAAKASAARPEAASSRWTDGGAKASAPRAPKPAAEPPRAVPRRKVPAAGYAAPTTRADAPPASAGTELISTTIQAAAELAQIGMTVGRQTLQSMLDRLPKP
jgi:hypothetical protein